MLCWLLRCWLLLVIVPPAVAIGQIEEIEGKIEAGVVSDLIHIPRALCRELN
jgi:hypothetical protein